MLNIAFTQQEKPNGPIARWSLAGFLYWVETKGDFTSFIGGGIAFTQQYQQEKPNLRRPRRSLLGESNANTNETANANFIYFIGVGIAFA